MPSGLFWFPLVALVVTVVLVIVVKKRGNDQ
jgi:hypothetical protein